MATMKAKSLVAIRDGVMSEVFQGMGQSGSMMPTGNSSCTDNETNGGCACLKCIPAVPVATGSPGDHRCAASRPPD